MTSKERVRMALSHKQPDIVPANFEAVGSITENLLKRHNLENYDQLLDFYKIDIRAVAPTYIGPEHKVRVEGKDRYVTDHWGITTWHHWNGKEYNGVVVDAPFDKFTTVKELEAYKWPTTDMFDYESIKVQCDKYKDKALIMGHEGPFQVATFLRSMENLFMDMIVEPEFAHKVYDGLVAFEMEHYEKILKAADGQIDILRPHDDYGTQISLLFSMDMWRDYFKDNTKKLVNLAHKHGAFYQQHSCGCVAPVIPELIECGVDSLEPLQKVAGLEPAFLKATYGDKLCFHGGLDTQGILPFGTKEDVIKEAKYLIETLNVNGGYIFMASQGLEGDVPLENIDAMYSVRF